MAAIELGLADIALLSDPGSTRVQIPRLASLSTTDRRDKAFVRFAGDDYPTAFRGEGREGTLSPTCVYSQDEQELLRRLVELIEDLAPAAPDSRLLLRVHAGRVSGMSPARVIEVDGDVSQSWSFETITASFTARVVQYALPNG